MQPIDSHQLARYLAETLGQSISDLRLSRIGEAGDQGLKEYGYGEPLVIDYRIEDTPHRAVLHTIRPGPFGHQHMADRAGDILWSHAAFNNLPRHVRSLGVGAFDRDQHIIRLDGADEFFIVTDYVPGSEYAHDFKTIRERGELTDLDLNRADALCDYLLEIHQTHHEEPTLYTRRIRELFGHSECILGIIDSYPPDHPDAPLKRIEAIERRALAWRWRVKGRVHRLRQVHGDFHPWNILFDQGAEFHLLDRSRGEWGDPADDVTCLTANYLFEAIQDTGQCDGPLGDLYQRFWSRYLQNSGDAELLEVAAPFIAFRGLVIASPVWYPHITREVRDRLLTAVENILDAQRFDPTRINEYLQHN